jgi:hypothetical protein
MGTGSAARANDAALAIRALKHAKANVAGIRGACNFMGELLEK